MLASDFAHKVKDVLADDRKVSCVTQLSCCTDWSRNLTELLRQELLSVLFFFFPSKLREAFKKLIKKKK